MKYRNVLLSFESLTIVWLICSYPTCTYSNRIIDKLARSLRKKLEHINLDDAEFKNLELNRWVLPCRILAGSRQLNNKEEEAEKRQFSTGLTKLFEYDLIDVLRSSAVYQCVALSESLQLSFDVFTDFKRAISEVQDGNPTGQEMFFRVLFLPFTFIVSMRDLLVKVGAYTAVAVLPLFW